MSRLTRPSLSALPAIWQGGALLALVVALLALGLSARDGLAAGGFNVNGRVAAQKISFDGSCNAGAIASDSPAVLASGGKGTGPGIQTTRTDYGVPAPGA